MSSPITVAFDADDTLWHNENAFAAAEDRFNEWVSPWADAEAAQAALVAVERSRLALYGYGVKSFIMAMMKTACELSNDEVPVSTLREMMATADELLAMPTVPIDGAVEAVKAVASEYQTMIITKGDLHHQLRRLRAANLDEYCFDAEVVAEKDPETSARILARHRIDPQNFVMIGNSVVSDIAPVLEIGAMAIHIPYEVTWALETAAEDPPASDRWFRVETITEVPALLKHLS